MNYRELYEKFHNYITVDGFVFYRKFDREILLNNAQRAIGAKLKVDALGDNLVDADYLMVRKLVEEMEDSLHAFKAMAWRDNDFDYRETPEECLAWEKVRDAAHDKIFKEGVEF